MLCEDSGRPATDLVVLVKMALLQHLYGIRSLRRTRDEVEINITWDCVSISEQDIANGRAAVYVDKELQRASKEALQKLDSKDVIKVFPAAYARNHTSVLLKTPKTKTSVRTVYMPSTMAEMLV